MEIQFYGANCIRLTTKKANLVIDDNLVSLGGKPVIKAGDIALFTAAHHEPPEAKLIIDTPGEYEVSDMSIQGIAAQAHIDAENVQASTMFKVIGEDIRVVATGHIYPDLSDEQLEALGTVDVLIIPVGGNGYTLDSLGALKVIKKIEPKIIIPTHYADKSINFPVPQQSLEDALKGLAMEPKDTLPKLKLKHGEMGEIMQVIVLDKS